MIYVWKCFVRTDHQIVKVKRKIWLQYYLVINLGFLIYSEICSVLLVGA